MSALIGLVTLTFVLETGAHYCCGEGNLKTNFSVSEMFRSRLMGQHLSDAPRDIATLTFNLGSHGAGQ